MAATCIYGPYGIMSCGEARFQKSHLGGRGAQEFTVELATSQLLLCHGALLRIAVVSGVFPRFFRAKITLFPHRPPGVYKNTPTNIVKMCNICRSILTMFRFLLGNLRSLPPFSDRPSSRDFQPRPAMGVCVSKVQSGPQGLEYTRGNEVLLSALGDQIETLAKTHPKEAEVGCEQQERS